MAYSVYFLTIHFLEGHWDRETFYQSSWVIWMDQFMIMEQLQEDQ